MDDRPRLIEVAFPLEQASLASVHEKNVRHGHISTLHVWPARRPLAACRAALLATLLPDPGDPVKRKALLAKIGGIVETEETRTTDADGNGVVEEKKVVRGGVLAWGQESDPSLDELRGMIREYYGGKAPRVADPFAGGGAIPLEAIRLGCDAVASDLNPVAWFVLKCTLDYPLRFAGKAWPLPEFVNEWPDFVADFLAGKVKRRGNSKGAHFSDPKQLGLPKLLRLPDADLAWHVRAWGRWVLEKTKADMAALYPTINDEPTVCYLWARCARDKMTAGTIPLLKTFWLRKKKGKRAALLPVPREDGSGVDFALLSDKQLGNSTKVIQDHPFLEKWGVTPGALTGFLNGGTMNRAGVWSPCSGRPGLIALRTDDLRRQGQQGLLGSQMTVVVVEAKKPNSKQTYKRYRLPVADELKAAEVDQEHLHRVFSDLPFGIPDEPTPAGGGSGAARAFSLHKYGLTLWRDLFTGRQLVLLGTLVRHNRKAIELLQANDTEVAEAVGAYLSLCLDRIADRSSVLCSWTIDYDKIRNTFARFAMSMCWDFAECVGTAEASGGYPGQLELTAKYLDHSLDMGCPTAVSLDLQRRSATEPLDVPVDLVVTDPPYYDAIPYSDLMDFFHIWLRRNQSGFGTDADRIFCDALSPKWDSQKGDGELVDDETRFGGDKQASKKAYEDGMAKAFKASLSSLKDHGRLVVVFANKEVVAWETLISALIRGGAVVSASWPIQTEREARSRSQASAALSSSVWIVCRKRPTTAQAGWDEKVLDKMKDILFRRREELGGINILQYYFDLGIRGPDFIWAALGPALEAYSAHPFVKKQQGGVLSVPEFLGEVRRLVLQFSLGELPGFRDVQRETQGRGEGVELDPVTQYYLMHRAYFGLAPAPAGPCILYANACGKNETELRVVWNVIEQGGKTKRGRPRSDEDQDSAEAPTSGSGSEFTLVKWDNRAANDRLGEARAGQPSPLIDRLHRLMFLLQQNQSYEVQQMFDAWGLASDNAFKPLVQAVRELALRDRQDTERRLVEALAAQLRMNRRTVVADGEVREEPLFEYGASRTDAGPQASG